MSEIAFQETDADHRAVRWRAGGTRFCLERLASGQYMLTREQPNAPPETHCVSLSAPACERIFFLTDAIRDVVLKEDEVRALCQGISGLIEMLERLAVDPRSLRRLHQRLRNIQERMRVLVHRRS